MAIQNLLNSWLGTVLGFIVGLIPLIIIHEFGHLMMAKVLGVWAREFGIGYPPRITKLFRWQETVFTLNWLPLGGFVRLEGEETFSDDELDGQEEAPAAREGYWEELPADSDAEYAVRDLPDAQTEQMTAAEKAQKAEEAYEHSLYAQPPARRMLLFLGGPVMNLITAWLIAVLIFTTGIPQMRVVIQQVAPESPAAAAELQEGDVIVEINDTEIETLEDVTMVTANSLEKATEVTVMRDGEQVTVNLVPRATPPEGEGAMGIQIGGEDIPGTIQHFSLGESLSYGTTYFARVTGMTVMLPVLILRMGLTFEEARPVGVVGISQIAQSSVQQSITNNALYPYLSVLMLVSISLGIFNLLPIPALDGGRILFALIEAVRGKRLTPQLEERIHMIALAIMVVLFVFITALDILMPVPIP